MSKPTLEEIAAQQAEHWNGAGGQRWAEDHQAIDAVIAPLGMAAIERLAPRAGEAVVDVGCGFGATAVEIAKRVTGSGRVLGVDLSGPQLEVARAKARQQELSQVRFARGDVAEHPFDESSHDAAFSRFPKVKWKNPLKSG